MKRNFKLEYCMNMEFSYNCDLFKKHRFPLLLYLFFLMLIPFFVFAGKDHMNGKISFNSFPSDSITKPIDVGSRLELFVDDYLIGKFVGKAVLKLHHPQPKEIALIHDEPWEGSGSAYHSVFKDGNIFRMYYKAWQLTVNPDGSLNTSSHPLWTCYAESYDGINWRKPELGLFDFKGSKSNNIVIAGGKYPGVNSEIELTSLGAGHPAVFKDENPDVKVDERYKAFIPSFDQKQKGLWPLKSPDGIHWSSMTDKPILSEGIYDSQNLGLWDNINKEYRAYFRLGEDGVRAIRTATSKDFVNWTNNANLKYQSSPPEHLYTSQIKPYFRAPHIFIGFPARYHVRGWSESMRSLPETEHRERRSISSERHGTVVTESLFMASRDGVMFKRWNEAFIRPGIEATGTWAYGNQYLGWGILETKSDREGAPNELSMYATESYWTGNSSVLRRYTLRMDGFVSVNAPASGGELITRPLIFNGNKLVLNFSTAAAGNIYVEIQDTDGNPLPGFSLLDCREIFGDTIEREVHWKNGTDVSTLEGKSVRLRFVLKDADLFSFRFQ